MGVGGGGWLLHVAAISIAPLSVVQVVLSGGVVLIAVMADRLFGFEVGPRQWWGLALTALGLILLGLTMPASDGAHSTFSLAAMVAFEGALFGIGGLLILGPRAGAPAEHHGVMLAAASGILFGVCNVAVKALSGMVGDVGMLGPRLPVAARRGRRLGHRLLRLGAQPPGRRRRRGHRHHRHRGQRVVHRRRHHRVRRPAARDRRRHRPAGGRLRAGHRRLGAHTGARALGARRGCRHRVAAAARRMAGSASPVVLAALTAEPTSTDELYDRVGYPALVQAGLIQYPRFRAALEQLAAEGLAEREPGPDGATLWWRAGTEPATPA